MSEHFMVQIWTRIEGSLGDGRPFTRTRWEKMACCTSLDAARRVAEHLRLCYQFVRITQTIPGEVRTLAWYPSEEAFIEEGKRYGNPTYGLTLP